MDDRISLDQLSRRQQWRVKRALSKRPHAVANAPDQYAIATTVLPCGKRTIWEMWKRDDSGLITREGWVMYKYDRDDWTWTQAAIEELAALAARSERASRPGGPAAPQQVAPVRTLAQTLATPREAIRRLLAPAPLAA